ncbi:MAG: ISLre2 family transposase [Bacillota bacterium]
MNDYSLLCEAWDFNAMEAVVWRLACFWARSKLKAWLWHLDRKLMRERPAGLRHVGVRERTLVTRVGEITIKRAYYADQETGEYRYLLDEALGLPARERASPGLKAEVVAEATQRSFRAAAKATGGSVSHGSVHRWLWQAGAACRRQVEAGRRRLFGTGRQIAEAAVQKVKALFCEADGVILHLQREARKIIEAKVAIMHVGWEPRHASSGEFALKDKLVYAAVQGGRQFWESLTVVAGRCWDLSAVKVIAGDGADWVKLGLGYFALAVYQLCRFHLVRRIRDCLKGRALERVLAARRDPARLIKEVQDCVAAALEPEARRGAEGLLGYLLANRAGLEDYRGRVNVEGVELRGLGAIESNVDKIVSVRMKKRGASWTIEGARNMLAVLSFHANGTLAAVTQALWGLSRPEQEAPPGRRERSTGSPPGVPVVHLPILDTGKGLARLFRRALYPSTSLL